MSKRIDMPKLGMTMTEGTIDEWYKSVGDAVKKGEAVCMIASEKLTMDVESPADGQLLEITVESGGVAKVGEQIGLVGDEGDSVDDKPAGDDEALSESGEPTDEREAIKDAAEKSDSFERTHDKEINENAIEEEEHPTEQSQQSGKRVFITPLAKKIAQEKGKIIPKDLSVLAFSNGILARHSNPRLSTISRHGEIIGEKSATLLIDKLENKITNTTSITVDTDIVLRDSLK